jgi:hypothetical protein
MICGYSERSRGCNAADIVGEAFHLVQA